MASTESQLIRTITEPSIILDDMQFADTEAGTSSNLGKPKSSYHPSKQFGGAFPAILINHFLFSPEQIVNLRLSSTGVRPSISISILVKDKSFYSIAFPKDGDLLSLFIRGKIDPFKPIRNDYEITSVHIDSPPGSGENDYDYMYISGTLRIPGFDAVKCFSFKGSSYKAMIDAATKLKLGFASNEVDTNDNQTWICPNEKMMNYIDDTSKAAWKDGKSFFNYFIDHYYYLNFVNVEPFYSDIPTIEEAISILRMSHDYGKDSELHHAKTKAVLSNWDDISQTQFYINNYSLINNSSSISLEHGYKRYVQYYDTLLKKNQCLFVDPITTPGSENEKQLLKGRPNEDYYLSQINTKWMGVQYGTDNENCHSKYYYAKVTNFQNNAHIQKMGLRVSLSNTNFNLRRMQTVPVIIMIKQDTVRKKLNEPADTTHETAPANPNEPNREQSAVSFENVPFLPDRTISGYYTIHDIEYIYEKGNFRQECIMYRREWPCPPQVH